MRRFVVLSTFLLVMCVYAKKRKVTESSDVPLPSDSTISTTAPVQPPSGATPRDPSPYANSNDLKYANGEALILLRCPAAAISDSDCVRVSYDKNSTDFKYYCGQVLSAEDASVKNRPH